MKQYVELNIVYVVSRPINETRAPRIICCLILNKIPVYLDTFCLSFSNIAKENHVHHFIIRGGIFLQCVVLLMWSKLINDFPVKRQKLAWLFKKNSSSIPPQLRLTTQNELRSPKSICDKQERWRQLAEYNIIRQTKNNCQRNCNLCVYMPDNMILPEKNQCYQHRSYTRYTSSDSFTSKL